MDPYSADGWHDFFVATAGAAAALTGLLFVALSLHIRYIASQPMYRRMARGSLIGLVQALLLSLVVLVQQPVLWLGLELVFIGVSYLVVVGGTQLLETRRVNWEVARRTVIVSVAGYLLALAGILGGINVVYQVGPGLYVTAVIAVVIILWNLRNAWVLLIFVADEEIAKEGL